MVTRTKLVMRGFVNSTKSEMRVRGRTGATVPGSSPALASLLMLFRGRRGPGRGGSRGRRPQRAVRAKGEDQARRERRGAAGHVQRGREHPPARPDGLGAEVDLERERPGEE